MTFKRWFLSDNGLAVAVLLLGVLLLAKVMGSSGSTGAKDVGDHHGEGEHDDHDEHDDKHALTIALTNAQMAAAGIKVETLEAGEIHAVLRVRGQISVNRDLIAEIAPRFPGTIVRLDKKLGDRVRKGELVAIIENGNTRSQFEVRSEITGVVTDLRMGSGGYASANEPIVVVTDLSRVWAEFSVPDHDAKAVAIGQTITIRDTLSDAYVQRLVAFVSPVLDQDTQSLLIRALVPNTDGAWRPGTFVVGDLDLGKRQAAVRVRRDALHVLQDGQTVVFVRSGESFEARPVVLGASSRDFEEVTSGLRVGEQYATANSYIVKAELLKATAEHTH